ncbi:helix-turn-helix domain-containing protein [Actinomadura sp. 6N118]|uniref:AraC-like ligand-binding domain-containing protein n=1 Tax=Actinomadura sp. 6N118 TaxID=3375151 RepID=UPI0037B79A8E
MDVISTAEAPAGERFAFWREVSAKLWVPFDLRCESQVESGFQARADISEFGPIQATLTTTTPHMVQRTPKLIRQADPEVFKLACVLRGHGIVSNDDRRGELRVGDLALFDSSSPYLVQHAPDVGALQFLMLRFPRALLPLPARDLRRLSAVRIPGERGVGALCSQFLLQLARHMHELSPSDTARLSTLTIDVLTAALADALEVQGAVPSHTRRRALVAQIHAFIQANLGDACLTSEAIAAPYLPQLSGQAVPGRRAHRRRLDPRAPPGAVPPRPCRPLLAARPINAIAAQWGFPNPAHFSQAFRSAYGLSPRQFRQQCATVRTH